MPDQERGDNVWNRIFKERELSFYINILLCEIHGHMINDPSILQEFFIGINHSQIIFGYQML